MVPKDPLSSLVSSLSTEAALVENPAIELMGELGWSTADLLHEQPGPKNPTGRASFKTPFLPARLAAALRVINPDLPDQALADAIDTLTQDRSAMLPVAANREVARLLRDGVPVAIKQPDGPPKDERVWLIDWRDRSKNDFFLGSQLWVHSDLYVRRPDLVGYVNGIPLLLMELKAAHVKLSEAYDKNIKDYRDTIPRLFDANAFVVLSNGHEAVLGPSHAALEDYAPWKKVADEDEEEKAGLETLLRGTCAPSRFLDIVENFIIFQEVVGGQRKVVGKYHQVLGVNRAIEAVKQVRENQGRLGVFWHTQGSGKSLSMAFFAEKVLRTLGNNWSFVVVTDRTELDDQIAATFASIGTFGALKARDCQAQSGADLREKLAGQQRYLFTLIQKFGTERGELMPVLSERSDVIVITDEAHRSQYAQLAANMRRALPNAAFLGFTGTPLMAGEERTREVFGDYVSIYNFAQSVADGATVPLFYEGRQPELQLAKEDLRDELQALLDEAELSPEQEKQVQTQFARQYHLITREDRLDKIAGDLARHFAGRGYRGKGMFVAIDKATAVRMCLKTQAAWQGLIAEQEALLAKAPEQAREALAEKLAWMRETDMAVVVSQSQGEIEELKAKGLDITPHRKRMVEDDLEGRFKDPQNPLRLVFVCAMWITGFDVPTCSTVYLDKPMKNHTLMQTIARANRNAPGKQAGTIVDYVGVFANLQDALAIYGAPKGDAKPIRDKAVLIELLEEALAEAESYAKIYGVDTAGILDADKLQRAMRIGKAQEALIAPDDVRRGFLRRADAATRAYRAVLPDDRAAPFLKRVAALVVVAQAIRNQLGPADISILAAQVEALLDENILGVEIAAPVREGGDTKGLADLSAIDFEKLAEAFAKGPRTTVDQLRTKATETVEKMAAQNPSRVDLIEKLEMLIDAYNSATASVEETFEKLKAFIRGLDEEQGRAAREDLTEDELAIYDLLTRPEPKLTKAQDAEVKKVSRELLVRLHDKVAVFEWHRRQQTRSDVEWTIREVLNTLPAEPYPEELWNAKVDATWQFVFGRPDWWPDQRGSTRC
ncbi:type I restriction endonuclease subunit R [Acidocella facilis]|uniref:type I restriction endonuclease subunit R n=1 Tax=Acidocella facilis TaxID=525 RepID=UPI001F3BD925|nr:type I restriction endonuclease subunit R [Acidocella facilis]